MQFNYLTINNITKICDNKIYLDSNGFPTNLQWYDEQIEFAIRNLDPTQYKNPEELLFNPITGYKLSRNQIYDILKSKNLLNINTKSIISTQTLIRKGLFKGPSNFNTYHCNSLGGVANITLQRDNKVKLSEFVQKKDLSDTIKNINDTCYNIKISEPKSTTKKRFRLPKAKKTSDETTSTASSSVSSKKSSKRRFKLPKAKKASEEATSTASSSVSSQKSSKRRFRLPKAAKVTKNKYDIIRDKTNTHRTNLGEIAIRENNENICRKLGKFDWIGNSCYADSILLGVIYSAVLNKRSETNPLGSIIYQIVNNFRYDDDNFNLDLKDSRCPGKTRAESIIILNNILDEIKKTFNDIESGKIISIKSINKLVNDTCSSLFTENFSDDNTHDSQEYYNAIINILGLKVANYQKETTIYYTYDSFFNPDNMQLFTNSNFITKMYGTYPELLTNGLGNNVFQEKTINTKDDINVINKLINSDILYTKYSKIDITSPTEEQLKANRRLYKFSSIMNKWIRKDRPTNLLLNTSLKTIEYDLQDFIVTRNLGDFRDQNVYRTLDDRYDTKTIGTDVYYYLKIDKDDPSKYKKIEEAPEGLFYRIGVKLEQFETGNIANYINFQLDRLHTTNFLTGRIVKLNCKIIPPEVMTIEGVDYNLDFIVLHYGAHYVNIYRCNGLYYLYNDLLANQTDYILEIGTYENLLRFNYLGKAEFALRNSTFISYSK